MNYPLQSNRDIRNRRRILSRVGLFLVLVVFIHVVFPKLFPRIFLGVTTPLWKAEGLATGNGGGFWGYFMFTRALLEENNRLNAENQSLKNQLLATSELQQENETLKTLLGRIPKENGIVATVLERPPKTAYDSVVIDAGSAENIAVSDKVAVDGVIVIGEVTDVFSHVSKVKLYSTAGEKTDVLVGSSTIPVTAVGRGGGNYEAQVPRDAKIKIGDTVTLPSTAPEIFATVGEIVTDPARTFQMILFKAPYNISELNKVEILKNDHEALGG